MAEVSYKEAPSMYNRNELGQYERMMMQINELTMLNQPTPEKLHAQVDSFLFDPSLINNYYLFPEVTTTVMKYYDNNQVAAGIGCFHAGGGAELPTEMIIHQEIDGYELYQWVKETMKIIWLKNRNSNTAPSSSTENCGVRYQVENIVNYQLEKQAKPSSKLYMQLTFNVSVSGNHSRIAPRFYDNQMNNVVNNKTESVTQGNLLLIYTEAWVMILYTVLYFSFYI
ncbi:hypothetical protein NE237_019380 [Protea cynaroides]|uniref:Uncharacterized protein n=1 Tax=Protea cynaroides TaxID=273540 RepID=A0A9Q0KBX5_9MAGN|nr:hypothetical protein NE237_019380 [Protea cynaroides]